MSYDDNIVDNPSKWGFSFVTSGSLESEPWQYYDFAVLKNAEGYWLTTDSGCSCPSPFESHMSVDDLTGPLTAAQVHEEVRSLWDAQGDYTERTDWDYLAEKLGKVV